MIIHELKEKFSQTRNFSTDDVNALMDFAKKSYIHNEISIKEYRLLVRELEGQGAVLPDIDLENSLIENRN
ncbi:YppF family protein [Neobacillus mesonae]|uniref:YppF family protein n=1 Tax=Neobacillus mesonae TaxID=1193713 RepID=UPI002041FEB9|nr:YppF family protein [Neobacillus mesonae]MCM3566828.1 YppF family protein [Neobacillus mesonae]